MAAAESWRALFESWPTSLAREGLLITTFQESIPFNGFLMTSGLVLLNRDKPDAQGGRKVFVAYEAISAIKITAPVELERFQELGFREPTGPAGALGRARPGTEPRGPSAVV